MEAAARANDSDTGSSAERYTGQASPARNGDENAAISLVQDIGPAGQSLIPDSIACAAPQFALLHCGPTIFVTLHAVKSYLAPCALVVVDMSDATALSQG